MTATFGMSDISVDETLPKARKPYTITKQREKWMEEEHRKFLEALQLHGRNWRRIEEHVGTKTTIQIRSHAQKFFSKVSRESTNSNNGTNDMTPIHIPPPRPKRKPARPYPRKLGSVKKPVKPSLKEEEMVVDQKENGSPTSAAVSTVTSELVRSESVAGSNELDNGGAQLSGSSGDNERIRCTSPQMAVTDSVPKFSSLEESAQRSEVNISDAPEEEEVCVESSDSPSVKLFGKTVAVKSVNNGQNINTGNCFTDGGEMIFVPENNTPTGISTTEATTQSSWHNSGMLPFFYFVPSTLWGPYGVLPYPLIKPEAVSYSDDSGIKKMGRAGSFTGSNSASNGESNECRNADPVDESGNNGSYSFLKKLDSSVFSTTVLKECNEKPVRGFVPYKRCVVEREKMMSEDGENELTRLCL